MKQVGVLHHTCGVTHLVNRPLRLCFGTLEGLMVSLRITVISYVVNRWIIIKEKMRPISLVLLFALCQIVGTMCTVPDLSLADDAARLTEEMKHMACPMDGTIMCPLSAVSSPERQLKHATTTDLNPPVLLSPVDASAVPPTSEFSSWTSASEFIPISIASSSVLRI